MDSSDSDAYNKSSMAHYFHIYIYIDLLRLLANCDANFVGALA